MLTVLSRNQLIQTLSSTSLTAAPFSRSSSYIDLATSRPDLAPLQRSDYPKVKHWVRMRGDASQVSVIKVVDADTMSDDDDSENLCSDDLNQEDGVLAFLENDNGKLISYDDKKQLYRAMRGFWNDHIDGRNPPLNWSSAGETLRNAFRDFLEGKFFYLRLCAHCWKVEELWKRNYHSWLRSFARRTANASSGQHHKRKHAAMTLNSDRDITRTKRAKMKTRAISVDADSDTNDLALKSSHKSHKTNTTDDLYGEPDKVLNFFRVKLIILDR
jgi:hypothetical protein